MKSIEDQDSPTRLWDFDQRSDNQLRFCKNTDVICDQFSQLPSKSQKNRLHQIRWQLSLLEQKDVKIWLDHRYGFIIS